MKLTVIGQYCVDVFHRSGGTEERRPGGIYHSIIAMSGIAGDRDTIYPVFSVGENEAENIRSVLSPYKNVDLSGMLVLPGVTHEVHYDDESPNEHALHLAQPIPFAHIRKFLNVDGVYVNMISGRDILIDTLDEIRLEIRGKKIPLHLDIHCLTLHTHDDGTRTFRPMADWRRWCFMTDSVQLNAEEAAEMSVEHFNDTLLAKQMIPLMVQAFIITRGAEGATLYREEHKALKTIPIPAAAEAPVVSTLGAGDVFGASLLYSYLKKKDYQDAAAFACQAATRSTAVPAEEKHRQLRLLRESL
ncbi:MAG: carbohydrate kinase family protein [Bacteroidetes bacterium]|nr:carbohydrate kinase family protein [Bacteroidota bacterium]